MSQQSPPTAKQMTRFSSPCGRDVLVNPAHVILVTWPSDEPVARLWLGPEWFIDVLDIPDLSGMSAVERLAR